MLTGNSYGTSCLDFGRPLQFISDDYDIVDIGLPDCFLHFIKSQIMLKIGLVDSHPSFRYGIHQLLKHNFKDIQIKEFPDYELFPAEPDEMQLIIVGINEDIQVNTLKIILKSKQINCKTIVFYSTKYFAKLSTNIFDRIDLYLNKNTSTNEILTFLRDFIDQHQQQKRATGVGLFNRYRDIRKRVNLSNREIEIVFYMIKGFRTMEISKILNIRPSTVSTHKFRIFKKTGTSNVIQIMKKLL